MRLVTGPRGTGKTRVDASIVDVVLVRLSDARALPCSRTSTAFHELFGVVYELASSQTGAGWHILKEPGDAILVCVGEHSPSHHPTRAT